MSNHACQQLLMEASRVAKEDKAFREALRLAGMELVGIAKAAAIKPSTENLTAPPPRIPRPTAVELVAGLTLGRGSSRLEDPRPAPPLAKPRAYDRIRINRVEKRCRLKAKACDWAEEKSELLLEGADYEEDIWQQDRQLILSATGEADCYLWMCRSDAPEPDDRGVYTEVARCYETLADALALASHSEGVSPLPGRERRRCLQLVATSQSMLRSALDSLGLCREDEQAEAFAWLSETLKKRRLYVERHMTLDDPAEPARWADVADQITRARQALERLASSPSRRHSQESAPKPKQAARVGLSPSDPDVLALRSRIAGKTMVLIGGVRHAAAAERLRRDLGLAKLVWVESGSGDSPSRYKHYASRPEVAVIAQLIRFSSHSVGNLAAECSRNGKPFIRLISGYSPKCVARQVLEQCSDQLG